MHSPRLALKTCIQSCACKCARTSLPSPCMVGLAPGSTLTTPPLTNHAQPIVDQPQAWMRGRGMSGVSVFTADTAADMFGVVTSSYEAVAVAPLTGMTPLAIRCGTCSHGWGHLPNLVRLLYPMHLFSSICYAVCSMCAYGSCGPHNACFLYYLVITGTQCTSRSLGNSYHCLCPCS